MSVEEMAAQQDPQPPVRELTAAESAFAKAAVKRVRDASKKDGMPVRIKDVRADAQGLDEDGIDAALEHALDNNGDFRRFSVFNGATFLVSDKYLDFDLAQSLARADEMRQAITRKIRTAAEKGTPTPLDALWALATDMPPEELEERLADLAADEETADIKRIVAFTGAEYLYSDKFMTPGQAEKTVRSEELQLKIVVEIRGDSKYLSQLTRVDGLDKLAPDLKPGEIEAELEALKQSDFFADIHTMSTSDGTMYAVSEISVSETYANILLRTAEKDPCFTIAETVRDESRTYPRPTNIEMFKYALFDLDRSRLDEYIATVLEKFEDIKRYDGPKESVYLYSDQYMTELQAEWFAKRDHSEG